MNWQTSHQGLAFTEMICRFSTMQPVWTTSPQTNEIPIVKEHLLKHIGSFDEVIDFALSHEEVSVIEGVRKKNLGTIIAETIIRRVESLTLSGDDGANEAITLLSEAVGWNPDHFEVNRMLADMLIGLGRNKAAGRHYVEANRIRPQDPHVLHGIAHTLYRLNRIEAAIPLLSGHRYVYDLTTLRHTITLGLALARRGRLHRGAKALQNSRPNWIPNTLKPSTISLGFGKFCNRHHKGRRSSCFLID